MLTVISLVAQSDLAPSSPPPSKRIINTHSIEHLHLVQILLPSGCSLQEFTPTGKMISKSVVSTFFYLCRYRSLSVRRYIFSMKLYGPQKLRECAPVWSSSNMIFGETWLSCYSETEEIIIHSTSLMVDLHQVNLVLRSRHCSVKH